MHEDIRMCDLQPGQSGIIASIDENSTITRRLLDLGVIEGKRIICLGRSLWKDPAAYEICGAVVAIRREVCSGVKLKEVRRWRP